MTSYFCTVCNVPYTSGPGWTRTCGHVGGMSAKCVIEIDHGNCPMEPGICACSCHLALPSDAEVATTVEGLLDLARKLDQ